MTDYPVRTGPNPERAERALELYEEGWTYARIRKELGYSDDRHLRESIWAAEAKRPAEDVSVRRRKLLAELGHLKAKMHAGVERWFDLSMREPNPEHPQETQDRLMVENRANMDTALKCVSALSRFIEAERAIAGVDAPPAVDFRALVVQALVKKGVTPTEKMIREIMGDTRALAEDMHNGTVLQLGSGQD